LSQEDLEVLPLALLPTSVVSLDGVVLDDASVTLLVRTASATACCPGCGQPSHHIHSRYVRTIRDLPFQGKQAVLRLTARKFFCRNPDCPRTVFCERLPDLVPRYARSTARLTDAHRAIAFALGGEAGSRLASQLAMPTSADTLLRRIKQTMADAEPATAARVIGVDDWAIRKGQTYGTIVIDLERGKVLELLPGRDGVELKTWLGQHPKVEIVSRDRWACFADAATEAIPKARQVADRWHLLKNAREALERCLDRHTGAIRDLFAPPVSLPDPLSKPEVAPTVADAAVDQAAPAPTTATPPATSEQAPTAKQQQRLERYHEVRRRHEQGQALRQIARDMQLSWRVVRRYVFSEQCPDWRPGRAGPSQAEGYRKRIDLWLAAGHRNVAELHRQLTAEGADLRYDVLRRFVNRRLGLLGERRERSNAAPLALPPPPSARELSFAVLIRAEKRTASQQQQVARLGEVAPIAEAIGLMEAFAALVRKQTDSGLKAWQEKVMSSGCVEMQRFAEGLSRDQAAVEAALAESWSNGPVEGQVNRLKTIKRQMYGRASFELLRRRVLHTN
jgi:transposase